MTATQFVAFPSVVARGQSLSPAVDLTIVLPFRDQYRRVRDAVQRISATLFAQNISFEVIAVSGPSSSGHEEGLAGLSFTTVIENPENTDPGAAVEYGVAAARGAWVRVLDVDAASEVDPHQVAESLHRAREGQAAGR
jgi:hypothetical protein